jgi:TPP-dependent trihydroxycyclohexane-1,2-dione (THcHDO) dehydratase
MINRNGLRTALTAGLGNGFASITGIIDSQYVALAVLTVSSGTYGASLELGRQRILGTGLGSVLLLVGYEGLGNLPRPVGIAITLVITDNRGFGCINRLQRATGGAEFNNLLKDARGTTPSRIDFAAHAAALGAKAVKVTTIAELESALALRHGMTGPLVVVIDTDPYPSTPHGGHWWDVAVPEVSSRAEVMAARAAYVAGLQRQRLS